MGIPVITLIHEFSAYIRPINVMDTVSLWSSRIVFSSMITLNDMQELSTSANDDVRYFTSGTM